MIRKKGGCKGTKVDLSKRNPDFLTRVTRNRKRNHIKQKLIKKVRRKQTFVHTKR